MAEQIRCDAFVLDRGTKSPYDEEAWRSVKVRLMDRDKAGKLEQLVQNRKTNLADQMEKIIKGDARRQIKKLLDECDLHEGLSGYRWIDGYVDAHRKSVWIKKSLSRDEKVTYTSKIDVVLARIPSGPMPYQQYAIPPTGQQYYQSNLDQPAALPFQAHLHTPPKQKKHQKPSRRDSSSSDTSSDSVFSYGAISTNTPITDPTASGGKNSRGRSHVRRDEPPSRKGSPAPRRARYRGKAAVWQDEVDKKKEIEQHVDDALKKDRAERDAKTRAECVQQELADTQRRLAELERRDRRSERMEYGRPDHRRGDYRSYYG